MKACGVVMAMVYRHNWVPAPRKGKKVNAGTIMALPCICHNQLARARLNKQSVDRIVVGRRVRSSWRPGKPVIWRRNPVCSSSSRNRKGDNRECGCSMACHYLKSVVRGTKYVDETAQVGDRRSVSSLR